MLVVVSSGVKEELGTNVICQICQMIVLMVYKQEIDRTVRLYPLL